MKEVSSANTSPVQPKPVSKTNSLADETKGLTTCGVD